jgi:hypothetical protein
VEVVLEHMRMMWKTIYDSSCCSMHKRIFTTGGIMLSKPKRRHSATPKKYKVVAQLLHNSSSESTFKRYFNTVYYVLLHVHSHHSSKSHIFDPSHIHSHGMLRKIREDHIAELFRCHLRRRRVATLHIAKKNDIASIGQRCRGRGP